MFKATFPSTIINQNQGSFILQLHIQDSLPDSIQTILTLTNLRLMLVGSYLMISNKETVYEFDSTNLQLESEDNVPQLTQGYNSILLTWEGLNVRILVHNKNRLSELYYTLDEPLNHELIEIHGEFTDIYTLMQSNTANLYYHSFNEFEEDAEIYSLRYLNDIINVDLLLEHPHPYDGVLSHNNDLFYRDFRENNVRYAKKPFLEMTPAPTDNSPILISDTTGFLYRQYFFDLDTGIYEPTNTESFTINNFLNFKLSYENIDPGYPLLIMIEDEHIDSYILNNNVVYLNLEGWRHDLFYGKTVSITYKLNRAYYVEYNEDAANYSYKLKTTDDDISELTIIQEGNSNSPVRLATEIELNPIVNSQHTGFIYIDKEEQRTQDFRLNVSSSYLIMDGMDSADFVVEAIDQYGNEILSAYLDVFITDKYNSVLTNYGTITPIINDDTLKARNTAGRLYFKYRAPLYKPNTQVNEILLDVDYTKRIQIPNSSTVYPIEDEQFGKHRRFKRIFPEGVTAKEISNYTSVYIPTEIGKTYTYTIDVKPTTKDYTFWMNQKNMLTLAKKGEWTTIYDTFTATSESERFWGLWSDDESSAVQEDWIEYRNMKVFEGTKEELLRSTEVVYQDTLFLNVYDRKYKLGTQVPIKLRAPLVNVPDIVTQSDLISPVASIPFEYIARYYERTLPSNHPLSIYDKDKDGYISREDWLYFKSQLQDTTTLQAVFQSLIEQEVF